MVGSLLRQTQLKPFFLGFEDSFNKLLGLKNDLSKNISNYPLYNITKINDDEFELEFVAEKKRDQSIKISLIPINCDHMILWLFEISDKEDSHFFSMIANVDNNVGMWSVQIINNKDLGQCSINSDINQGDFQNVVFRNCFEIKLSPGTKKIFKIVVSKI
jgi:hypothetical protein